MKSKSVKYYSTNRNSPEVTFREALLKGLAKDGGLYLPDSYPSLSRNDLESFTGMDYPDIAYIILNKLIGGEIDKQVLIKLCNDAYQFSIPLEKIIERKYIMRLDQGPTASFKDFAARMMSRLMQHFLSADNQQLTILTATSGDTGGAVANAFYGLKNINVFILYPNDEVTLMQRRQMTTLKGNIKAISVNGKFDDCQYLVKKAFMDPSLAHIHLSSANSINIGRLLPQTVYYFYAWSKLKAALDEEAVFSVPSGNFGNLMAGLIAARMGLPVKQFIVATNDNKEVPEFLRTGIYTSISPSINNISSAMNVGHPSNLARIIELYGGHMNESGMILRNPDMKKLRKDLSGISVSDEDTMLTIAETYRKHKILLEPHGAIAWKGIKEYCRHNRNKSSKNQLFISLETAHPAKFPDEIRRITGFDPPLPNSLNGISDKDENFYSFENSYETLKEFIQKHS